MEENFKHEHLVYVCLLNCFFIPVKNSIIFPRIENLFGKENENTTYKRVFNFLFVEANKNTEKTILKTII